MFSETAETIAQERYSQNGESIESIFNRVAWALAKEEKKYLDYDVIHDNRDLAVLQHRDEFYKQMRSKKLIPAGRTLANAGTSTPVVANCVVLPIEDSMDGIGGTLHKAMLLQQQGCGIGFDFSSLRPAGFETKRSRGKASGPVSFLKIYDSVFSTIKQQGRHGANMGMLRIDHPDILDFINCKQIEGDISNFNISVLVTEEFMQLLMDDSDIVWHGRFNGETYPLRNIEHKKDMFGTHEIIQEEPHITVQEVWDILCEAAHRNGEPGVAFIDTINDNNPLPGLGPLSASNPCGEQMLHPYDNCNLMSINLAEFYNPRAKAYVNWEELDLTVRVAVRMLDNTIDLFNHNVDEVNKMAVANRRIGLGVMGWADLLMKCRIRYGSKESLQLAHKVMSLINDIAYKASKSLANTRGVFPNIGKSVYDDKVGIRNVARTSIAPTGSIAMLFDVNSGIEPYFNLAYKKKVRAGTFTYVAPELKNHFDALMYSETEQEDIITLLLQGKTLPEVNAELGYTKEIDGQDAFVTAMEIAPNDHVAMQAQFQEHTDNAISKTINLPNGAKVRNISEVYVSAWESGCKAVAVYRDKSREYQILNTDTGPSPDTDSKTNYFRVIKEHNFHGTIQRPRSVGGITHMVETAHGKMYVVINSWQREEGTRSPYEVFVHIGKEGGDLYSYMSALTRMISIALRSGVPVAEIVDQLTGISCHTNWDNKVRYEGPVDALAKVLHCYDPEITDVKMDDIEMTTTVSGPGDVKCTTFTNNFVCSNCDSVDAVVYQEGCETCQNCGWSKC